MTITYTSAIKAARLAVVRDAVDAGVSPGYIEIGTAGMAAVLVTITLSDPGFAVSGNTLVMQGTPKSGTASGSGTAAAARIRDSTGADVATGLTVGTSATDIVLDSVSITLGQTVTLNSGVISHG